MSTAHHPDRHPDAPGPPGNPAPARFDPRAARPDFPALAVEAHPGVPLVYLDSAATALKPWAVLEAVRAYDVDYPANVHRGIHALSERATEAFEGARAVVARFLGAAEPEEVVFTRGTTEAINLVAQSWGRAHLHPGDEVVVSLLEHHSNLVPWQMLARERGLTLRFVEPTPDGRFDLDALDRALSPRARLVAVTAMSNVLGTVVPLAEVVARAHAAGAVVVVDAAQGLPHLAPGATAGADFVAFSGHKLYGPTGVGVLHARAELLDAMPPWMGGGGMVLTVDRDGAEWNEIPWKHEAGTAPIAQAIGLGAAIEYLESLGHAAVAEYERDLTAYAHRALGGVEGVRILGPGPEHRGPILGFTAEGVHPHDLAQLLDRAGVAVRAGHHCAMPLHRHLGLAASARASFGLYTTTDEVDRLAGAVADARRLFRRPRPAAAGPAKAPTGAT